MQQIKEYKLVMGAEGGNKFADEINKLIAEGWQPIGGVSVIKSEPQKLMTLNYWPRDMICTIKYLRFKLWLGRLNAH
jgi:hypothetical protein